MLTNQIRSLPGPGRLTVFTALLLALAVANAPAQRQMERLGRGVVAARTSASAVYVGWRLLGDDPEDTRFNLYRVTGGVTNLLAANVTSSCNFVDNGAAQASAHSWFVQPILNGVTQANSASFSMPAAAAVQQYLNIPLQRPAGGTSPATADGDDPGGAYTYNANDCSAADVDGDGEYEIIVKWDPSNSKDNAQSGFTGNTILDCYKLDGTRLWRINLGPNIRSGAHYMDFMVYDFDGDGKAELMCRTAPGALDGLGSYVAGVTKWQNANGLRPAFNDADDYRNTGPNGVNGYVLAGPEFLSVFDGETGAELATSTYYPKRDPDNNDDNPTSGRINTVWGDGYGNRIDRFLAGLAFVDGQRPSAIFCRGYYTRAYLAAWDWRNGAMSLRWTFASDPSNTSYRGQGAHSLSIGDADGDGKDEILFGAASIDHNGQGHYSTQLGHGDALHFSDMDPLRPGLEVWMVHESPGSYGPNGLEFRDAKTGGLIFGVDGQGSDVGRGVAFDLDPRYRGYEMWGSRGGLMSATGAQISTSKPSQQNFCVWWDADMLRETLDGTAVRKWDWNANANNSILSPAGLTSNNGTKSTPCLSADLFGDWREEIIWRTTNNLNLRIYTTTTLATNRFYTLMHDSQYRSAIAWQNTGYNQPPHLGFFLGNDMYPPPLPQVSNARLAWRGGNSGNDWSAPGNWFANGIWTNNVTTSFSAGDSVLFDLRASNNTTITLASSVSPAEVTVNSPANFTVAGAGGLAGVMKLHKAGSGRLTLANVSSFTGGTIVSGGQLIVNGELTASPVVVEARGEPAGRARIGGSGVLGQGLTVQKDCGIIVGPGTNAPGTFTITNGLALLGGVMNQFDLSNNPTGTTNANDLLQVFGNVSLSGTNTIDIKQLNTALGEGVYPLIKYTGTLSGGLNNLSLSGSFLQSVALTNPPGMIALVADVPDAPPVAPSALFAAAIGAFQINLAWTDNSTDEIAFLIERAQGSPAGFAQVASVAPNTTTYQDVGLVANTAYYYRVRGTNLAGFSAYSNTNSATTTLVPPSLTWKGDGLTNFWDIATTPNWLNGAAQTLYADGAFVTLNDSGSNSPAINLATTLAPGSLTVNATKAYTLGGSGRLNGAMTLTKSGSSSLTINNTNTFTGGIVLSNGTLITGNPGANNVGLGSGAITLRGGTLEFNGWTGNSGTEYGGNTNALVIQSGHAATIHLPQRFQSPGFTGPLTGAGALNLRVKYLRCDVAGNWANFTGTINVTRGNAGVTVDDFRVANAAGFPNARLSIGTNVLMYSRASAGSVIPIGEFTGAPGAIVTAGGCSGNCGAGTQNAITWRVGGLDTDATNAALFSGTTSLIKEGAGTWTLTQNNTYSGTTVVNEGTLVVLGDQAAATNTLTVNNGGTLAGTGVIGGNTTIAGMVSPGTSIGTLTFARDLNMHSNGITVIELRKSPKTNDVLRVLGTLSRNGDLIINNVSTNALTAGDSFTIFDAPTTTNQFENITLPPLGAGLMWETNSLYPSGTISVINAPLAPPVIQSAQMSGNGTFRLTFTGSDGQNYEVRASTNIALLPLTNWQLLISGVFTGNAVTLDDLSATNYPRRFYLIRVP